MKLEKTCSVHGELSAPDILIRSNPRAKSGLEFRCKKCTEFTAFKNREGRIGKCGKHGQLKPEDIKANGRCSICHRESANRKRNLNREWFNEKMAKDREENPEKWEAIYKKQYAVQKELHGHFRVVKEICRTHDITIQQYESMFEEQDHKCAICNREETRTSSTGKTMKLCVDHDHETGIVRGLLCHACNTAIGKFEDDIDIMHSAIIYLEKHKDLNG